MAQRHCRACSAHRRASGGIAATGTTGGDDAPPKITTAWRPNRPGAIRATVMPEGALTPSERQLHRMVAQFLDYALMPPTVWTTFPAGWGKLSDAMAGELRACGLKKGFPDILIFAAASSSTTHVIGIELKTKTKASAAQQVMFPRLRAIGMAIYICHNLEEVIASLKQQGIYMRAKGWENETASNKEPEAGRAEEPAQGPQAA